MPDGPCHCSQHRAPPCTGQVGRSRRPAPQGRGGVPKQVQSSSVALIKAKRRQSARRFLGQGAAEDVRGPRSTHGMAQTCTISTAATFQRPGQTHVVHTGQAPPTVGQSQRPRHCVRGQSRERPPQLYGGKGARASSPGQPRSPQQPGSCLGGWRARLEGARLCPARMAWPSAAEAVHPAEVSGTEVTSKEKGLWRPVCTHRPALPQGLPEGRRRKLVPLTPLFCSFYL